jgi:histidyl-tRNA synthetase
VGRVPDLPEERVWQVGDLPHEIQSMIKAVKGTRDILPPASAVWNHVERVAREVFRTYNYQEIRTPIFEETALFARGVGADTDIVGKEMYTFEDRDGSSLTLRPENTASVMRAYIEHRLDQVPGVKKFYYMGPMFRRERPQKGRFRQFYQIGAEAIGSESAVVDGEVIEMVVEILARSGLAGFQLIINSVGCSDCRPAFNALLKEKLAEIAPKLCTDCQRRAVTNPLRVLDCKVPEDQPYIDTLPSILDHLGPECQEHFNVVKAHLHNRGIAHEIRPRLVRGLDYYTRTTFEVTHGALGAQNSVLGGGRYDGLAELIGSRVPAPGIGFSIGEDRLVMSVEESHPGEFKQRADVFLIPFPGAGENTADGLAADLRNAGFIVERAADRKLKRAMEIANKVGARFTLILGDDEVNTGTYSLKDMTTGEQHSLSKEDLFGKLRN